MKILILGKVVGIARERSKVTIRDAEIIEGTPYDYETVKKAIIGCDSVISTLNIFPQSQGLFAKIKTPLDSMSVSIKNTVNLMEEKGIRRIVVMTALGVGDSVKQLPGFFAFMINVTNIKHAYADHDRQEKILEKSSLDWTVVRPVGLTDKNENLSILHNLDGAGKITSQISRNAVAHFMLDCIEKGLFIRQKPGISNS
jgi:putative NADH-flavin reductase